MAKPGSRSADDENQTTSRRRVTLPRKVDWHQLPGETGRLKTRKKPNNTKAGRRPTPRLSGTRFSPRLAADGSRRKRQKRKARSCSASRGQSARFFRHPTPSQQKSGQSPCLPASQGDSTPGQSAAWGDQIRPGRGTPTVIRLKKRGSRRKREGRDPALPQFTKLPFPPMIRDFTAAPPRKS